MNFYFPVMFSLPAPSLLLESSPVNSGLTDTETSNMSCCLRYLFKLNFINKQHSKVRHGNVLQIGKLYLYTVSIHIYMLFHRAACFDELLN